LLKKGFEKSYFAMYLSYLLLLDNVFKKIT